MMLARHCQLHPPRCQLLPAAVEGVPAQMYCMACAQMTGNAGIDLETAPYRILNFALYFLLFDSPDGKVPVMPFADETHLSRAAQAVDDLLAHLAEEDWMAPTPCTGWSVADVAQHLVEVNLDFADRMLPAGFQTPAGTTTPGDFLGSYRHSVEALNEALATQIGDSAVGIPPQLSSRLALRVADLLTHSWDIASATGTPLHLPPDLCAEALTFAQSRSAALQRSGQFAPPQPIHEHAPAIDRLAALSGRQVHARPHGNHRAR